MRIKLNVRFYFPLPVSVTVGWITLNIASLFSSYFLLQVFTHNNRNTSLRASAPQASTYNRRKWLTDDCTSCAGLITASVIIPKSLLVNPNKVKLRKLQKAKNQPRLCCSALLRISHSCRNCRYRNQDTENLLIIRRENSLCRSRNWAPKHEPRIAQKLHTSGEATPGGRKEIAAVTSNSRFMLHNMSNRLSLKEINPVCQN